MHPALQISAIRANSRSQLNSSDAAFKMRNPCAYAKTRPTIKADSRSCSEKVTIVSIPAGTNNGAAISRVVFSELSTLAPTAASIMLADWPIRIASITVHRPVPFWPALSIIKSTISAPVCGSFAANTSAVIPIK